MDPRFRQDRSELLSKPELQADGTVIYDAVLSRAGVFNYQNDDGSWRQEYRSPAEVFSADSMRSFESMAATEQHHGEVNVYNRSDLNVGYVVPGTIRRDGLKLLGKIHVTDAAMIAGIRAGRTAVSLGYFQDRVREDGVSPEDGKRYQYRQTNIRGNHAALGVDVARAGDDARIRVDSFTAQELTGEIDMKDLQEALNRIVALEVEAGKNKLRMDSLESDNATLKKSNDKLTADLDTANDKLNKSEKLRQDGEANAAKSARARIDLENTATKILTVDGNVPKFDGKTDRQIRESVIVKLTGKEFPTGKTDEYVSARFDGLVEDSASRDVVDQTAIKSVVGSLSPTKLGAPQSYLNQDGSPDVSKMSAADARSYNAKRDSERWMSKQK